MNIWTSASGLCERHASSVAVIIIIVITAVISRSIFNLPSMDPGIRMKEAMWHELKNVFHFLIIFQCVFFAIYLLSRKTGRRTSNLLLAGFLLTRALVEFGGVLNHFLELKSLITANAPYLLAYTVPFRYASVPFLFLYVLSLTNKNFSIRRIHGLHFIPFLLFCVLAAVLYHPGETAWIASRLQNGSVFFDIEIRLLNLLEYLQFFAYAAAALAVLKGYRRDIKEVYSSIESINLSWLRFVVYGFAAWKLLRLTSEFLWLALGRPGSFIYILLYYLAEIVFLAFLCVMFLKGLKQPVIFGDLEERPSKAKYEKTMLSDALKSDYREKLLRHMDQRKPHLDPQLSLKDLSDQVAVPLHHLSQVINSGLNQNFYDFVNSYRIKESQRLLSEKADDRKTVLDILLDTGFNSKSSFNLAFKKFTGMTPTQFRKLQDI